jgi:serine/threonine-protein kinase
MPEDPTIIVRNTPQGDNPASGIGYSAASLQPGMLESLRNLKTLGRYDIRRELGRGGSGLVYLGWDPLIKRRVAIKVSRPASEEAQKTFFIEAQSAGKLNHPNIIAIYDTNLYQDYCYLVMEYIDGVVLSNHCTPNHLLPLPKVSEIIDSVCKALDYAHQEGIIHKDVKPSNIMLDKIGAVKIADFSIAQEVDSQTPAEAGHGRRTSNQAPANGNLIHLVGTPSYMSPEHLRHRLVGRESDIFSLGCVLYEMLTGVKAFTGDSLMSIAYKIMHEDPVPVTKLNPNLAPAFDEVIRLALAKNPGQRYMTCTDLAADLKTAVRNSHNDAPEAQDFFDFVHGKSFFRAFTKDQVRELVTASNVIRVGAGRVIIQEGDTDDVFYILLSGKVVILKEGIVVATIDPGECFGEMSYLASQPRSATVVAETSCSLLKIKSTLLNKSSESVQLLFFRRFATILARRVAASLPSGS